MKQEVSLNTVMFCCMINRILEISSVVFEDVSTPTGLECWPSSVMHPARRLFLISC
jgi:hypothetical protein